MRTPFAAARLLVLLVVICSLPLGCAAGNAGRIEEAVRRAEPGAIIYIPPGTYRVADLEIPPEVTLYAPSGATLVGNLVVRGPGTVIRGLTFDGGSIDISESRAVTIGDCAFRGGETAIRLDGATEALIINNDFRGVSGGVITGWGLDRSTISGNHFAGCGQCINLAFNNDRSRGRNIVVERNRFRGVARMPLEVGPLGAYTENLVVRDNWAEDFRNRGPDPGDTMSTFVAYSLVPTNGVNTVITGNYAIAGPRGRGDIGIELAGSGQIAGNHIEDFRFGAIVYGAGFSVHDNLFLNATDAAVLNYGKQAGRIDLTGMSPKITRPPERRDWPCRPAGAARQHVRLPDWPCD
ncbi:MAG TPA: right-handed parallel beta-helix repeat-containing protein [Ferrovibrio sp.]|uniref:right-handed parallel beta-helix repeat-containing protein n=1 Tax=Ferrovibrio sp. TaxID=1917215 RepID=UPI002B4B7CCA|nr:right-handed parallel beta-helix repeat-containing protein [Ferrovibrio sp.]HLT76232.1 right-handed parallel beta-helix repeat-containing protein [Ferrovibrio sp.]